MRSVNIHHHTKTCRKYNTSCRFYFPRFPSLRTVIAEPVRLYSASHEVQKEKLKQSKEILKKVRDVLENEAIMEEICKVQEDAIEEYMKELDMIQKLQFYLDENKSASKKTKIKIKDNNVQKILLGETESNEIEVERHIIDECLKSLSYNLETRNFDNILKSRLLALLKKAEVKGQSDEEIIKNYEEALGLSEFGYKIIHKRDVNEIMVNNYNSEWIRNWNANMDLQLCPDFYAVVTYISDYYSKDDSGTMRFIMEALKDARNESLANQLSIVVHKFFT